MSFANPRITNVSGIRPLTLALALAFPISSMAAGVSGKISANGLWYDTPSQTTIAETAAAFSENVRFDRSGSGYTTYSTATAVSDGSGHFGSSVLAQHQVVYDPNPASATAKLTFADTITNSTGFAQAASFNFAINSLAFTAHSGALIGDNTMSFAARIYVNGSNTPAWESTAAMSTSVSAAPAQASFQTGGSTPLTFNSGAPSLIDAQQGYAYSYVLAGPYSNTLNLGNIAAGDSLSVRYEIDLYAQTYAYGGLASISFDDPSSLALSGAKGEPLSGKLAFAQPVPEPETYAMMMAGLALLAGSVRRRRSAR